MQESRRVASILATAKSLLPINAIEKPLCRAFPWAGTGLEPVTPSLSIWCSRSRHSLRFAQPAWFSGIHLATERLSERKRTLFLAILATQVASLRGRWSLKRRRSIWALALCTSRQPILYHGLLPQTTWS